jgi:hypothetical protein
VGIAPAGFEDVGAGAELAGLEGFELAGAVALRTIITLKSEETDPLFTYLGDDTGGGVITGEDGLVGGGVTGDDGAGAEPPLEAGGADPLGGMTLL